MAISNPTRTLSRRFDRGDFESILDDTRGGREESVGCVSYGEGPFIEMGGCFAPCRNGHLEKAVRSPKLNSLK